MPGSLAWIAATHGGPSDDAAAELETQPGDHARRDAGDRRRAAKQAKAEKRLAARRAREEQRAAAKAEKERAKRARAEAKDRAAAERAEVAEREAEQLEARKAAQKVEDERARQLAEEQAAAARVEQDRRRQAESEAAEQKAQRREKSKAAALAALAGRPATSRADESDAAPEDPAPQDPAAEEPDGQDPTPGDGAPEDESSTSARPQGVSGADLAEETALLDAVGSAHQDDEPTEVVGLDTPDDLVDASAEDSQDAGRETERDREEPVARDERGDERRAAAAATVARRREKAEAKERARAEKAAAARRRRAEKAPAGQVDDSVPEPPSVPQESSSFGPARIASLVGVAIGVLGLVASVLLALAALLVAFGFEPDAGVLQAVAMVADPLTAPLRGLVSFSGENAAAKEAFVAYGGGSVVYLIVGVAAPSLLSRRDA